MKTKGTPKNMKRFSAIIPPDFFMRAEKQAKIEGITVSALIEKHLPEPEKRRKRMPGARKVSFKAPEALVLKTARSHETSVRGLVIKALVRATQDTVLTPDDYRELGVRVKEPVTA